MINWIMGKCKRIVPFSPCIEDVKAECREYAASPTLIKEGTVKGGINHNVNEGNSQIKERPRKPGVVPKSKMKIKPPKCKPPKEDHCDLDWELIHYLPNVPLDTFTIELTGRDYYKVEFQKGLLMVYRAFSSGKARKLKNEKPKAKRKSKK